MKFDYIDEKEKEFYEGEGWKNCIEKRPNMLQLEEGKEYWIGIKVNDAMKANAFFYDVIATMNGFRDEKERLNTELVGIDFTEFGLRKYDTLKATDKIMEAINILSELV